MTFIRCVVFLLIVSVSATAQTDSCLLRISLLTCSPGAELYSTFGHTAIRITDKGKGIDEVYNYGTFDDRDPNFYVKFTKGIMIYALSNYSYADFLKEYEYEGREVIEQELRLSCAQKQQLYAALQTNALDQNRFYNYYFHTDNCTTRARDMIATQAGAQVKFHTILPTEPPSFRNLIHEYLNKGGQYWSKLGIDMLLGSNLDEKATNEQAMFLPDYLMKAFDTATINNQPAVVKKQIVLQMGQAPDASSWFRPGVFTTLLLLLALALTYSRKPSLLNIFDSVFFLLTGLMGVIIIILWIIRVDTVCRDNFNLLWAFPTHFFVAFVAYKKWNWVQQYFRIVFIASLLAAIAWWFVPQQLNPALLPVLGTVILRSFFRSRPAAGMSFTAA